MLESLGWPIQSRSGWWLTYPDLALWKIWKSMGRMTSHILWKVIKLMFQSTNQRWMWGLSCVQFGSWDWPTNSVMRGGICSNCQEDSRGTTGRRNKHPMGMGQYLLIPFLVGWTSIYQGFDPSPYGLDHPFFRRKLPFWGASYVKTSPEQRLHLKTLGNAQVCTQSIHKNGWKG